MGVPSCPRCTPKTHPQTRGPCWTWVCLELNGWGWHWSGRPQRFQVPIPLIPDLQVAVRAPTPKSPSATSRRLRCGLQSSFNYYYFFKKSPFLLFRRAPSQVPTPPSSSGFGKSP